MVQFGILLKNDGFEEGFSQLKSFVFVGLLYGDPEMILLVSPVVSFADVPMTIVD
jgi:hypothetical protein